MSEFFCQILKTKLDIFIWLEFFCILDILEVNNFSVIQICFEAIYYKYWTATKLKSFNIYKSVFDILDNRNDLADNFEIILKVIEEYLA